MNLNSTADPVPDEVGVKRQTAYPARTVVVRVPAPIAAVVGIPAFSGLAWVVGARHQGQSYAPILRRAIADREGAATLLPADRPRPRQARTGSRP